jgi:predicted nicotinamide N-methyase
MAQRLLPRCAALRSRPSMGGLLRGGGAAAAPAAHAPAGRRRACRAAAGAAAAGQQQAAEPPPGSRLEGAPLGAALDGLPLLLQEFAAGGAPLRVVCPADPDAVLDRYIAAGADGDPYWTRVWPSALALAAELLRRPGLVAGLRVADLGGGRFGGGSGGGGMGGARGPRSRRAACAPAALGRKGRRPERPYSRPSSQTRSRARRGRHRGRAGGCVPGGWGLWQAGDAHTGAQRRQQAWRLTAACPLKLPPRPLRLPPHPTTPQTGAKEVVLLDREPLALQCGLLSARATGLPSVDAAPSGLSATAEAALGGAGAAGAAAAADAVAAERRASHAAAGSSGSSNGGSSDGAPAAAAAPGAVRAAVFDWSSPPALPRFDVVLACDVLYEADAVGPISEVVPRLLKSSGGLLLLADPPNRTAANRERFLELLRGGAAPFAVNECYEHRCVGAGRVGRGRGGPSSAVRPRAAARAACPALNACPAPAAAVHIPQPRPTRPLPPCRPQVLREPDRPRAARRRARGDGAHPVPRAAARAGPRHRRPQGAADARRGGAGRQQRWRRQRRRQRQRPARVISLASRLSSAWVALWGGYTARGNCFPFRLNRR